MLSCKEVAIRASALIDGELSTWDALQMRIHLAMCKGCDKFIGQMRITRDLTRMAISPETLDQADDNHINEIFSQIRNSTHQGG